MVYLLTSLPRIYTILMVGFLLHPSILKGWVVCKTVCFSPFHRWKKRERGNIIPMKTCMLWSWGGGWTVESHPLSFGRPRFKVTKRGSNGLGHRTFFDEIQVSYIYLPPKTLNPQNESIIVLVGGFSNDCIWEICKLNQWHVGWSMKYIQRVELFSTYMLLEVQVPH